MSGLCQRLTILLCLGAAIPATVTPSYADDHDEGEVCIQYLLDTAYPGYTMERQGPRLAIERLHPVFRENLCAAIKEARGEGIDVSIFSAYRPPAFGIGGFRDKFDSCHSYGLAVDLLGIGGPGSDTARRWHTIARKHGVIGPYGPNNHVEFNHFQPVSAKVCGADRTLRASITPWGPADLQSMFDAARNLLSGVIPVNYSSKSTRYKRVKHKKIKGLKKSRKKRR